MKKIEKRIARIERTIERAKRYVEKGINVEGSAFLHLDDWEGNSGHPKWVKNKMIPTLEKEIVNQERIMGVLEKKEKEKKLEQR